MIEEINDASSAVSKNSKADDPVSVSWNIVVDLDLTSADCSCPDLSNRAGSQQPSIAAPDDRSGCRCSAIEGSSCTESWPRPWFLKWIQGAGK